MSREENGARADQEPGFWNEWTPPRSEVARAVQFPIDKPDWPGRVINAYQRDTRPAPHPQQTGARR